MFDFMYFVDSESDFETEHCVHDWLMNYLTDNSVLISKTAVKNIINMNEVKLNAIMLLSWLFLSFIQYNQALSAVIESNSWT